MAQSLSTVDMALKASIDLLNPNYEVLNGSQLIHSPTEAWSCVYDWFSYVHQSYLLNFPCS